jgi:hypothetical protein
MSYSYGGNPSYVDYYPDHTGEYGPSPSASTDCSMVHVPVIVKKGNWSITYTHNFTTSSHYGGSPSSVSGSCSVQREGATNFFG